MIRFSDRNEKITRLFAIIFWILVGFHIIFGCIPELVNFAIVWLNNYQIVDTIGKSKIFKEDDVYRYREDFYSVQEFKSFCHEVAEHGEVVRPLP